MGAIDQLSQNFTSQREKISEYLNDKKMISAYVCFYMTTNMAKFSQIIERLNLDRDELANYEVIDVGSGPGTYFYAMAQMGINAKFIGIEKSALMREQAKKLHKALYPTSQVTFLDENMPIPHSDKKRLILFSHSANEMDLSLIMNFIKISKATSVLFIEPGTKEFFSKMLELRSNLIEKNFNVQYPCPSSAICPMQKDDWCHQILKVELSEDIKRLCQLVKKDRLYQPVSLFYFVKDEITKDVKRVVRSFKATKFSLEFLVCEHENNSNNLVHLQQMKKSLPKSTQKVLDQMLSGEKIQYNKLKVLDNGIIRAEIEKI